MMHYFLLLSNMKLATSNPIMLVPYNFRGGKGILYDKMVKRNDSIIKGQTKEEWIKKDIVDCIYDKNDDECNLKPGSTADLAMVIIA